MRVKLDARAIFADVVKRRVSGILEYYSPAVESFSLRAREAGTAFIHLFADLLCRGWTSVNNNNHSSRFVEHQPY
jgi:hypothetical protein